MNVVLVHPIHGAKIATMQAELDRDVENGWTEYNPDTLPAETRRAKAKAKVKETAERPVQQSIEQPNGTPDFLAPVNDESEGS